MTPLERQHRVERRIRGDGCPADLTDFAREVLAAEWRYSGRCSDVPISAANHFCRMGLLPPRPNQRRRYTPEQILKGEMP